MGVTLESMIERTRIDSGLRNNRLFSNAQIASLLTDAYADLRDKMIVRFAYWFRSTYQFTLAGGNGNNVLDLSLIPDLEMVQGLDLLDSSGNHYTVDLLSSFQERNQYLNTFASGVGGSYNGFIGRKYFLDGDSLFVIPAANAQGSYELIYTPQQQSLTLPITVNFDMDSGDVPAVPPTGGLDGTGSWAFLNASDSTDQSTSGFDLVLSFDSPNAVFSGIYPVVDLGLPPAFGRPTFGVSNLASSSGFTGPAAGSGAYTYQPIGTISELPNALTPWSKYLILCASIAIRTSRRQRLGDLVQQLERFEKRIVALTKQRSQGVTQAPLTRASYGYGGQNG